MLLWLMCVTWQHPHHPPPPPAQLVPPQNEWVHDAPGLSYKIRDQKTTENGSDCWKDYLCPSAHPPRTVYTQSEEKGSENHSQKFLFFNFLFIYIYVYLYIPVAQW